MCNFFFCHYVFKKPSATEASESFYMRERVKGFKLCKVESLFWRQYIHNTNVLVFSYPLLLVDAFWSNCKILWQKEKIAHNEQFLCCHNVLNIITLLFYRDFSFIQFQVVCCRFAFIESTMITSDGTKIKTIFVL